MTNMLIGLALLYGVCLLVLFLVLVAEKQDQPYLYNYEEDE